MLEKRPCGDAGKVLVTFRVSHRIWADHIALVGDFAGQSQKALCMLQSAADPDWHTTLELDAGKDYRYRYVLDGCGWNTDDHADDYITDPTGQEYCVLLSDMTSVEPIASSPAAVYRALSVQRDAVGGIEAFTLNTSNHSPTVSKALAGFRMIPLMISSPELEVLGVDEAVV